MKAVIALLAVSIAASAQTPKQDRGKQIVGEALQALGGDKFQAVTDRVETGRAYSFFREQLSGLAQARFYVKYSAKPEGTNIAQRERQSFGKEEDYAVIFLPDNAYQITFRGAKPIQLERFNRYIDSTRRNIFYILRMRLNEPGLLIEHQSSTVWSNMPVEVVDITDSDNNVVTVYFHRSTKMPVRQVFTRRDPRTKQRNEEESIFAKFRDVGNGVQWPFSVMTYRNGEKIFEQYADSVVINSGLAESLFTIPSGLKVLPRDKESTY